jgi:biotin carboxyl carrier protein
MPGVILEVRGEVGERVEAGTTLIVLEAMKMEHHVKAPTDGVIVELFVTQGQQVENGGSLLVIEPEEEEEVIS